MAEDSDLERTEPASSRRIEQAREEGNVPQSRELTAFLVLLTATCGLWALSDWFSHRAGAIFRQGLSFGREAAFSETAMISTMTALSVDALLMTAPIFLLTIVAAVAARRRLLPRGDVGVWCAALPFWPLALLLASITTTHY